MRMVAFALTQDKEITATASQSRAQTSSCDIQLTETQKEYAWEMETCNEFGVEMVTGPFNVNFEFCLDDGYTVYATTPLIHVVSHCLDIRFAEALLARGADINYRTRDKRTALTEAILNSDDEMIIFLINNGADVNMCSDKGTPLQVAIATNNCYIVNVLLEHGASPKGQPECTRSDELLNTAIDNGNKEIVSALVRAGIDVNDYTTIPPLVHAVERGLFEITKTLLEAGAEVNASIPSHRDEIPLHKRGKTALHIAIARKDYALAQLLLAHGANIHVHSEFGKNACGEVKAMRSKHDRKLFTELLKCAAR